jgi:hypothetical protein
MKLISMHCPNCGADLNIDSVKDTALCEHCNSTFIVNKAINNYNSSDFVIQTGKLQKYNGKSTEVIIPNTVKEIGEYAFNLCSDRLKSIVIPNSVTHIGEMAFYNCDSLTSIVIPNSVVHIGQFAFFYCSNLTSIVISNSLVHIGESAFENCSSLTSIIIPNSVTHIGYSAFGNCSNLKDLKLPLGITLGDGLMFSTDIQLVDLDTLQNDMCYLFGLDYKSSPDLEINGIKIFELIKEKEAAAKPASKSGGCYIATAVYGSYDSPQVLVLRRFRDDTLSKSTLGRLFIKFYYRFSPPVADRLKNTRRLNSIVRRILDKFVNHLSNKR